MKLWHRILITWGAICLAGIVLFVSYIAYSLTFGNKTSIDEASKSDVRFVLNWCGLGDNRINKVIKSYASPTSLTGDHLDAYSIKITDVTLSELQKENITMGRWYRCDSLPKTLDDAIEFMAGFEAEISWFPKEQDLRTKNFYVYPWSMGYHGVRPYSAQLIFLNPKDKIVYYIDGKI
ncbi:hypothetical protein ACFQZX_09305 [Mucilaginibacter litoreus]|uniref:Uncharacterized protein n=1 Tax=Mucilaginibacter litoreus TaxID=1048221 RepID=A0ABW3ASI3_9SPHI